ncbi:transposable element Tcb1 transposase [Trichonephila clavipes]|uniref:Transposable element Tcb1 transposase n=1 Tax=Trichonephila clavipes TaxID=2585209 RepID=A0A8X6S0E0_TRICX|nr:transposable element Tcb1 transposase [Trichonephila clavipes]
MDVETSKSKHPATIAGIIQAGGLWSGECFPGILWVHSSFWKGTIDQYKHASVLADHVHPIMRIVFLQNNGIYQHANARYHSTDSVRAWFKEHQNEFTVLPWPTNSPDLNPIENLWNHPDRVVRTMDPHQQLVKALESAWLNIPVNTFRNLIDSLPARLVAVRSAKGGYYGF